MNVPGPTGWLRNRSRLFPALVGSLHERTTLTLVILFCVAVGIMVWHVARLQGNLIESMALANADLYSQALTEFRTLYTREVVERVRPQGIVVTHDYESREGAIPLPATLSMKLGQRIGTHQAGAETRLYSAYPFPWREEQGGLQDRFGREAWEFLTRNPDKPFYRFEEVQGRPSLRYATADLMRASCVDCHNTHPASPKVNWKVGDVRGVLEIIHPMDALDAETWSGIGETFGLMVLLVLVCSGGLGLAVIKLRRVSAALEQRVEERTANLQQANQELERQILERRKVETALSKSERQHRKVMDNVPALIAAIDRTQRHRLTNKQYQEWFGLSSDQITGRHVRDLLGETLYQRLRGSIERALSGHQTSFEVEIGSEDGNQRWIAGTYVPEIDDSGAVQGLYALITDITEHKQAEEALASLIQQHQLILNSTEEGIYGLDLKGNTTFINLAAAKMIGWEALELIGQPQHAILHHSKPDGTPYPREECPIYAAFKDGAVHHVDTEVFWRKDGTSFPVEYTSTPIRGDRGDLVGAVVTYRDITERKRAEERLHQSEIRMRQAQKMEAIGTLAGGIAHDFNNILAAILGYTELALSRIPHEDRARQNLKEVLTAGSRAKELVQHILTFSRQKEQEKRPMHLHLVVTEVLHLLRATLPVTIEIRDHLVAPSDTILADPTQMHQVLMNLCTNAEHAMRERGGILDVWLEAVEVTDEVVAQHPDLRPGPHVRLTVRDTGQGMAPKVQERIFDPFFTTKGVGEGTGMGLAVVHGIVADHGGTIVVDSVSGQGTTFAIYIPRIDPFSEDQDLLDDTLMQGSGRVLFVDDEGPLVVIGQQVLEGLGYEVVPHTSGVEALAAFRAAPHRFDVVVTDQTMPHLTGEELARKMLRIRPDLPIILCTGFSYTMTAEKARALGIRKFLMKPVLARDLALVLLEVMEKVHHP